MNGRLSAGDEEVARDVVGQVEDDRRALALHGDPAGRRGTHDERAARQHPGLDDPGEEIDVVASAYAASRLPDLAALGGASAGAVTWWLNLSTKPLIK